MTDVFNLSIPHLRQWSQREAVDHRVQNEPVEAINRMITGIAPPRMRAGTPTPLAAVSAIAQFRLTQSAAAFPDHLVCRTWDGTTEGAEDVLVAKSWLLRRTPFDGHIYGGISYRYVSALRRTASVEEEQEIQIIIPPYYTGDILYASSPIRGGTGVVVGETPVLWLDDNRDSRAWAAKVPVL